MAVSTVDEYLSALEKSKLLGSEQLAEAHRLAGESSDAAALARALARDNLVSRWQAGTLLALGVRAQLRLGKYKLIQKLGKGGMGTVFLAEHVTMNRRVALKIVPRSIAEDRASLDRFFAEARAIAALDHPNIVQAYSVDNEMDRYFIVMEFVDGQNLQRMVETDGPLDPACAANYIHQAAEGLVHAHARNLVHCDIKPSNLLVNNQGVIKILDLGLARLNRSEKRQGASEADSLVGTVDYMAPEQALGTEDFDHRADIYSLGCSLYFLLTGHPPFPEGTVAQRIVMHQMQEPRDILKERPGVPPKLVEVCRRMMAKEPGGRYSSMQAVSAALAPLAGLGSQAAAPRAVTPLTDASANGEADDWLASLTAASAAKPNGVKPAKTAKPAAPAKTKDAEKAAKSSGIAAAFVGAWAFTRSRLAWFNTTKRIILGIVAAVSVLGAVGALAALPFLMAKPKPAPQPAPVAQGKTADKKTPLEEEVAKAVDSAPLEKTEPAGTKEAPTTPAKPDNKEQPKDPKEKPAETKTEKPPAVAPKPPVKPQPAVTPKPDPKPPVKPANPPVKPDKKPETPPVKPPEEKKISLEGLAAAVNLPSLPKGAGEVVSLGKVEIDPKLKFDVELLGGSMAAKGNPSFDMQKDGDQAGPAWSIRMAEKNKAAVKVARLWHEAGELKIQWTADARDKASFLRFCGLQFLGGKKPHFLGLTAPKTAPAVSTAIDASVSKPRQTLTRDFALPDVSLLRLQVLPLDKTMPPHEVKVLAKVRTGRTPRNKPQEPAAGDTVPAKGLVLVALTKEKPARAAVGFSLSFDGHGNSLQLDVQSACEMKAACEVARSRLPYNSKVLLDFSNRVDGLMKMGEGRGGRKPPAEQTQLLKTAKDELKALQDLAGELSKGTIPYRIFAVVGESDDAAAPKVVIFESGQAAGEPKDAQEPKATGPKKNVPKGKQPKGQAPPEKKEESPF